MSEAMDMAPAAAVKREADDAVKTEYSVVEKKIRLDERPEIVEEQVLKGEEQTCAGESDRLLGSAMGDVIKEVLSLLQAIRQECRDDDSFVLCLETLRMYITNILEQPLDAKYQRINLRNENFFHRVGRWNSAIEMLKVVGFHETTEEAETDNDALLPKKEYIVIEEADPMRLACAKMATEAVLLTLRPEMAHEQTTADKEDDTLPVDDKGKGPAVEEEIDPMDEEEGDGNDDLCVMCLEPGELICCDGCPNAYHLKCNRPPIELVPEGDWYCAACAMILDEAMSTEDMDNIKKLTELGFSMVDAKEALFACEKNMEKAVDFLSSTIMTKKITDKE